MADLDSEQNNECTIDPKVRLFSLPVSVDVLYICFAPLFVVVSVALNAFVIKFYRKSRTCSRTFVFVLVFRDFATIIFRMLPFFSLMIVQECRTLLRCYSVWLCSTFAFLLFENYPSFFMIIDRFCHLYLPHYVPILKKQKCFFLAFHILLCGLLYLSIRKGAIAVIGDTLKVLAIFWLFFVLMATFYMTFVIDHHLDITKKANSTKNSAATTQE